MIFLQDTLGIYEHVIPGLEAMVPGWYFHTLDVKGRSDSLELGTMELLNVWCGEGVIRA